MKSRTLLLIPIIAATIAAFSGLKLMHDDARFFEDEFKDITRSYDEKLRTISQFESSALSISTRFQILLHQAGAGDATPPEIYSRGKALLDETRESGGRFTDALDDLVSSGDISKTDADRYNGIWEGYLRSELRALEHTMFLGMRSPKAISDANESQRAVGVMLIELSQTMRALRKRSTKQQVDVMHRKHNRALIMVSVAFVAIVLVSLLVVRVFDNRFRRLMHKLDVLHGPENLRNNDESSPYSKASRSQNEFERLEAMADELAQAYGVVTSQAKRLEESSILLEETVRERTAKLEETNLSLSKEIQVRRLTEKQLRVFERVVANSNDGIFITGADGLVNYVNAAFEAFSGMSASNSKGKLARDLVVHDYPGGFFEQWIDELEVHGAISKELQFAPKNPTGERLSSEQREFWLKATTLKYENGYLEGMVSFVRDISDLKMYEKRLEELAFTDELTGLFNRRHFEFLIGTEITRHRRGDQQMALLYLDLDNFKAVNDALGHAAGDELLKDVATLLKSNLREADIIGRCGGDEFTVLLTQLDGLESAGHVSSKLLRAVSETFADLEPQIGISIGISVFPQDGVDSETLQINADRAMYLAKSRGKNRYETYSADLQRLWERNQDVENTLKSGLDNLEFELYFQPILDLTTRNVVAAEALIRWHRDGEVLPPIEFISLAEKSDVILEIDKWVLDAAGRQLKEWQIHGDAVPNLHVNLSSKFIQKGDMSSVSQVLEEYGLKGSSLCFEITETAVISDLNTAHRNVLALRAIGSKVSLDDFGTGFSSLNHLASLPIDSVKIDREFIKKIDICETTRIIIGSISTMVQRLGQDTIAEGIETEKQLLSVRAADCRFGQGYLFGKPLPASAFAETWLAEPMPHD
jgi:diguanylate cyclase (GGDEF)-like protein/PAS domain S-box-containing protein